VRNMPILPETVAISSKVKGGVGMWGFKKCPRCLGDIFIDDGIDRCYEKCLQCGYERELERVRVSRTNAGTEKVKTGAY
jgi:hypothetical protein